MLFEILSFILFTSVLVNSENVHGNLDGLEFAQMTARPNVSSLDDDYKFFVEKLSLVSRIVNAITLQLYLADSPFFVDDIILELLNIGESVNVEDLQSFEKNQVDDFLKQLKNTGGNLSRSSEEIEKSFIDLNQMKTLWTTGDWSHFPRKSDVDRIEEITKWRITIRDINNIYNDLNEANQSLSSNDSDLSDVPAHLESLETNVRLLKEEINLTAVKKGMSNFKGIINFSKMMEINDRGKLTLLSKFNESRMDLLLNLEKLNQLKVSPSISMIFEVVSSRFEHNPQKYTAGLVNRFRDLESLHDDVNDEWFMEMFKSDLNREDFKSISQLYAAFSEIDFIWKNVFTRNHYQSVRRIKTLRKLASIPDNEKIVSRFNEKCRSILPKSHLTVRIKELAANIYHLTRKVDALDTMFSLVTKKQIDNLKQSENSRISGFIQSVRTQLEIFRQGLPMIELAREIEKQRNFVQNFDRNPEIAKYVDYFRCFQNIEMDTEEAARTVKLLAEYRNIANIQEYKKPFGEISEAISKSKSLIPTINSTLELSSKLKEMDLLRNISQPFGEAVTFLVMMKNVLEKGSHFETFIRNGHYVQELSKESSTETRNVVESHWKDFEKAEFEVTRLLNGVRDYQMKMKLSNVSIFNVSSVDSFFAENTFELPDVDLQVDDRLIAIQKLGPELKKYHVELIKDLKTSLVELSPLDLQFSRFSFSLKRIPEFLETIENVLANNRTAESQNMIMKDNTTILEEKIVEEEAEGIATNLWWVYLLATVLFLILVFIVVLSCSCCWTRITKRFKKNLDVNTTTREKDKDSSVSTSESNSTPEVTTRKAETVKEKPKKSRKETGRVSTNPKKANIQISHLISTGKNTSISKPYSQTLDPKKVLILNRFTTVISSGGFPNVKMYSLINETCDCLKNYYIYV